MAEFSKRVLSGSTNGRAILVAGTASPGTTIHTGSTATGTIDEVWLYAQNTDGTARKLTVQWGGTASPDDLIELTLSPEAGLVLIAPGLPIQAAGTALVVRAFAGSANVVTVHGYVNRIA